MNKDRKRDKKPSTDAEIDNQYWQPWSSKLDHTLPIPRNLHFNQIVVETLDTIRLTFFLDMFITHQKSVLVIGATGTGKSTSINEYLLNKCNKTAYKPMFVNFSASTNANQIQDIILSTLDKRQDSVYGPSVGQKCVNSRDSYK